jgi:hypothetical protein
MTVYPWKNSFSTPEEFSQNFGFMERFFTRFLGREGEASQFTIMGTVEFQFAGPIDVLESRLRETWRAMRHYSPSIAALSNSSGKTYAISNTSTMANWERTTFKVHSNDMTAEKLFRQVERTAMVTLHYLPSIKKETDPTVHQLVFQAEHHHIDGRGVYYFFDQFFRLFTAPELRRTLTSADERTRLPPMMDDLLGLPKEPTVEQLEVASHWIGTGGSVAPLSAAIEPQRAECAPTISLRSVLRFSEQETLAVVSACKCTGVSVTSAWMAAIALSLAHFQSKGSPGGSISPDAGLATFATVDMRKYFPRTFDAKTAPLACYHAAIPIALRVDGSFLNIARSAHAEFHGNGVTKAREKVWAPLMKLMGDAIAASNPKQSMPLISSLGIADDFVSRRYGEGQNGVEVLDVWIADTMMSATNLWMLDTWRGRLNFSVTYNEAYFPEAQMDGMLAKARQEFLQGLSV